MENRWSFSNKDIAKLLEKVAAAYEILDADRFRIAAYQRASVSIEHSTSEAKDLWDDGKLDEIPGVGKAIAGYLDELFRTGKVKHFDGLFKKLPPAIFVFLEIPGVGPKTAHILAEKLKITSKNKEEALNELKNAGKAGKIRILENFGEKSEQEILSGIQALERGELKTKRMLLYYADAVAGEIIAFIKLSPEVIAANPLGSLRRKSATVGDIDISVATLNPKAVMNHLVKYKKIRKVMEMGEKGLLRAILVSGQQVDIRFSKPESYGAMVQYFTGGKQHNIMLREFALRQGMSLSEYGIKIIQKSKVKSQKFNSKIKSFKNEKDFYNELGLEWIPPELREGTDEINAARDGKLPKLVELSDIKGDLHLHSDFDIESSHDLGESPPKKMIEEARRLGYDYLGFSEHNPSNSKHTAREIIELLKRKKESFEQLNSSSARVNKLSVFNGLEIDIKPDGLLAIPEEGFEFLDYGIASIHSVFDLVREKMTERVLRALSHPKIKIFGHPTGRLLDQREGYELDWDKIFDFCQKNNKFLEISAWPDRLDLPDAKVREAIKYGVKLVINSDSHSVGQMKLMEYGVSVARRGWAEKKDIINCLSLTELSDILLK